MNPFNELPVRDDLRGQRAYNAPELDVAFRMSTGESPYTLPIGVADAVEKAIHGVLRDLNRHPDRNAVALREDLASYLGHGLTEANVWAANGSTEIQQQLFQAFAGPGREAMGFSPSGSIHPALAANTGTRWLDGSRNATFQLTREHAMAQVRVYQPDLVVVCSPNNPTGTACDLEVIEAIASEAPGMVIVDEAYAEFARPGVESALSLLPRFPRLVVTRTMSNAFSFAGARLGYLAASERVVEAVQLVRLPYHLSTLTQAAARAVLAHASALLSQVDKVKAERDRIVQGLRELGLTVIDSDANFVLFGRFPDSAAIWQALLDRGILVRDVGLAGWLRVTVGTAAETEAFLAAMGAIPVGAQTEPMGGR